MESAVQIGGRERTGDVQLGKTLQHRALSITEFPERHRSPRRFPSFREMAANGVTTESRESATSFGGMHRRSAHA